MTNIRNETKQEARKRTGWVRGNEERALACQGSRKRQFERREKEGDGSENPIKRGPARQGSRNKKRMTPKRDEDKESGGGLSPTTAIDTSKAVTQRRGCGLAATNLIHLRLNAAHNLDVGRGGDLERQDKRTGVSG